MTEYVTVWKEGQPTTLRWAAPVVRCKDCKFFSEDELGAFCTWFDFEDMDEERQREGFCSWGERLQDAAGGGRICAEEGVKP